MITLKRIVDTGKATLGLLLKDGQLICFTLEDTGTRQDSETYRIPPGNYRLVRCMSARFGETFTVAGVKGHDLLRIHCGNSVEDTRGCILVGLISDLKNEQIFKSKEAHTQFMAELTGVDESPLQIE